MGWIAFAYGIVLITLTTYVLLLRRRLREATSARRTSPQPSGSVR
jgi:hypothetical protein